MIGVERALAASGQPALGELHEALACALGSSGSEVAFLGEQPLKARVFRLRFAVGGAERSVVVKRLEPAEANRCERMARRWLPAVGLESAAPRLLAVSSGVANGAWHVSEDLGDETLDRDPTAERAAAAIEVLASLHVRWASHRLLPECRAACPDYGSAFFSANVHDAIEALESIPVDANRSPDERSVRDRLLDRLGRLHREEAERAGMMAAAGGSATLLHGDPWTTNAFVTPAGHGLAARFVDWDRAGVGPASYDLSTFLLRFPRPRRAALLERYLAAVVRGGGRPPDREALEGVFETAELSRYANRVIWPARAIASGNTAWGFTELAEVERWFEALEPVLEHPTASRRRNGHLPVAAARRLIVNADDLGLCSGVNRGIVEAHRLGIVTSASLMVERPAAREAAAACRETPGLSIGLHADLRDAGAEPSAADVRALLARQAERFVELMGHPPTHLDSHRNAHVHPRLLPEFQAVARRWSIPLRGYSSVRTLPGFFGQWNGEHHPEQIGVEGLIRLLSERVGEGVTEISCHPGHRDPALESSYAAEREIELATLCSAEIRRSLAELDIALMGFHELGPLAQA